MNHRTIVLAVGVAVCLAGGGTGRSAAQAPPAETYQQQMAREQREQPERRRWSRDTDVRYHDRSTIGRRLDDDDDDRDEFDDSAHRPPGFFLFGRRSRW